MTSWINLRGFAAEIPGEADARGGGARGPSTAVGFCALRKNESSLRMTELRARKFARFGTAFEKQVPHRRCAPVRNDIGEDRDVRVNPNLPCRGNEDVLEDILIRRNDDERED